MQLFLAGGFLGSGKTTAIQQACATLLQQSVRVGVVTNDQGTQLVDTGFIKSRGIPVMEVTNGCFCCHFDQLHNRLLALAGSEQPEIIFAESVGSCTDLVATVIKPLKQFEPAINVSLSVFADATAIVPLLKGSRLFRDEVKYIYKKQLDEADVLVVNKTDLLDSRQLEEVKQLVKEQYPDKTVLYQCSFDRENIEGWLSVLQDAERNDRKSLQLDYTVYGGGEAALAWFDAELEISSGHSNATDKAHKLIEAIFLHIHQQAFPIGHLKFLLNDGMTYTKISLTSFDLPPLARDAAPEARRVKLLINARVQAQPAQLEEIIRHAVATLQQEHDCRIVETNKQVFQPGFPQPTYRILDEY
ncbi:MAG: hypothetical protein INR73_10985 [Williamsia sp.]|nr:hypothetical protein [Williamsia sp.]